jgi:siderophore synthetase component
MNMVTKMIEENGMVLLEEETKWLKYLQMHHPVWAPYYLQNLEDGRKGILRKLAASLLRENLIEIYSSSIKMRKIGSVFVMGLDDVSEFWKGFLHQLQKQELREDIFYLLYRLDQRLLVFPIEKEYAFGRFILTDNILLVGKETVQKVETSNELLDILGHRLPEQAKTLQHELENGTANYTSALSYFEHWKQGIQKEAEYLNARTITDYTHRKTSLDPLWSTALFFEQLSTEGHHLHPGAKTKTGMKPEDVFRFSPEFHQSQMICFVAVKRDYLLLTEIQPYYIESVFPSIREVYQNMLREKGYNSEEYRVLPVHEWQYKNAIGSIYRQEIEAGVVVLLDGVTIQGGASSSFRTIWPEHAGMPAMKLAVNSQMTSTVRSISTQTAMNSLRFTNMMKSIMEREYSLETFVPINEVAGYSFRSSRTNQSRNLTVVVRESIDEQLQPDEVAIPGCSLYNVSPISGKTILAELVEDYCYHQQVSKNEGTISFLKDYLSIIIPGFLTLMVKYGVALEGHLQNSVPVFKNGKLVRFYFRDWGGARIVGKRLRHQGIIANFYQDSVSVTEDETEMRNKLFYTVFQNHIGELIVQLCQHSGLSEKPLWKEVKRACDKSFTRLEGEGIPWVKEDASFLYKPFVRHKALTKMRLYPDSGYLYSTVTNPLFTEE